MTDAVEMLDHWNCCFPRDALNQTLATAGHDHIDEFIHSDKCTDRGAICRIDQLHCIFRQPRRAQAIMHTGCNHAIGMNGFGTSAQNAGITRFQTQRCSINSHIGARLVNDADNAERHTHAPDLNATGAKAQIADDAYRVRQRIDLAHTFSHLRDRLGVHLQTI